MKKKSIIAFFCFFAIFPFHFVFAGGTISQSPNSPLEKINPDEAQQLYQKYKGCLYQIRVLNRASGKIAALGSGFQFTPDGYVATNYHVVSEAIREPLQYRLEYLKSDGTTGLLNILDVDVVNDLAVVKGGGSQGSFLELGETPASNGVKIFSLGNPHDLGMAIVDGTYNGLIEKSMYRKIHFSGSLNGGVSGGPAINHEGKVVGINVATYGNQLSFLVPVDYLKELYAKIVNQPHRNNADWNARLEHQLLANQERYMKELLEQNWDSLKIDKAVVPGEISSAFKCWGESSDKDEELNSRVASKCSNDDYIYVSSDMYTGQIVYRYLSLKNKGLNSFQFYNLYQKYFSKNPDGDYYGYTHDFENADGDDVTNFRCQTSFIKVSGQNWKISMCVRRYKRFQSLFDVNLSMGLVSRWEEGFLVESSLLGVTQNNALAFAKKLLQEIQWQK